MKTATILLSAATLCCMSASAQVSTMEFDVPIHQMRIYNDTLFLSSAHAVDCRPLDTDEGFMPYLLTCAVVYDFVKCGDRLLDEGTPTRRLAQHPRLPQRVFRSEPLGPGMMGYSLSKSDNFGGIWWTTGQELQIPGRPQFAFHPRNDELLVYGMNEYVDCICPFLLHSTDGLATFESIDMVFDREMTAIHQIAFSPTEDNVLIAATTNGMARSDDGGATWTITTPEQRRFTQFSFDDLHPGVAFAVEAGELPTCICDEVEQSYIVHGSTDDGKTWHPIAAFSTPTTYYQSSKPWNHTGHLQGLTCHNGNLYAWADEFVFELHSPLSLSPMLNGIQSVGSGSEDAVYSLQGYRVTQPQTHGIYIRDNRKFVAK